MGKFKQMVYVYGTWSDGHMAINGHFGHLCSKMQPGNVMCFLNFYTLVFWTPLLGTIQSDLFRGGWEEAAVVSDNRAVFEKEEGD